MTVKRRLEIIGQKTTYIQEVRAKNEREPTFKTTLTNSHADLQNKLTKRLLQKQ